MARRAVIPAPAPARGGRRRAVGDDHAAASTASKS